MKIAALFSLLFSICTIGNSQNISKANFKISDNSSEIITAEFLIGNISLVINANGEILNFNYLPGGDFDYYKAMRGKKKKVK